MCSIRRPTKFLGMLKKSSRVSGVVLRRIHAIGPGGDPDNEYHSRVGRWALGAGSLGLALLAADLVFNGA